MTSPRALLSFGALVVGAIALDVADYARLRLQRAHLLSAACGHASKRPQRGTAPHAAYERHCAAFCAGASHA